MYKVLSDHASHPTGIFANEYVNVLNTGHAMDKKVLS